jgi:DNA-binding CsgD family transcriptional regulator
VLISSYSGSTALAEAAAHGAVPERRAWRALFEELIAHWGSASTLTLRDFAPSLRAIPSMSKWIPRYERAAASPAMIGALVRSGFGLDATALLPKVRKPTLVLHLSGDRVVPVAFGRMLGERIQGARYVELSGSDHFSWVSPSVDEQIDLLFEFTEVGGSGARVGALWDPASVLTLSERRIVRLAQRGLKNAEIAKQQKVSLRTVENHLVPRLRQARRSLAHRVGPPVQRLRVLVNVRQYRSRRPGSRFSRGPAAPLSALFCAAILRVHVGGRRLTC